jgi:hypothetical protein
MARKRLAALYDEKEDRKYNEHGSCNTPKFLETGVSA